MPIPWLVVLQNVPWTDVIRNAPKVADGAKKLWSTVAGNPAPVHVAKAEPVPNASPETKAMARLEVRIVSLEASATELHSQMLASSEIIKTLAEQNGQLVARIEANRVRLLGLSLALVLVAVVAAVSLLLVLQNGA